MKTNMWLYLRAALLIVAVLGAFFARVPGGELNADVPRWLPLLICAITLPVASLFAYVVGRSAPDGKRPSWSSTSFGSVAVHPFVLLAGAGKGGGYTKSATSGSFVSWTGMRRNLHSYCRRP